MTMCMDYINSYLIEEWKPVMSKDEFLERYGAKFLMYMYMEYTLTVETIPNKEIELYKTHSSTEQEIVFLKLKEEFGEVNLAKWLIIKFTKAKFYQEQIVYVYGESIFQDMMNFLIK